MRSRRELARLAAALGGLPILGTFEGSPAAKAGVRYGDVLLAVDGRRTSTWEEFVAARESSTHDEFTARIFRDGKQLELSVVLGGSTPRQPAEVVDVIADARIIDPADGSDDSDASMN